MNNKDETEKNIYFYAVDPGAFAVTSAIVEASPDKVNCYWVAEGYAKQILNSRGINTIGVDEFLDKHSRKYHDNILVLGSQHKFERTVEIIKKCAVLGIKTIFVFDHWCNFDLNFTSPDGSMKIPTRIFVMDDYVKSKLISLGIDKTQIATIGHPGIEYAVKAVKSINNESRKKIRKRLGLENNEDIIVFVVLEPVRAEFNADLEYGMVLRTVEVLKTLDRKDIQLVIRLHPRQSRAEFSDFLDRYGITDSIILCPEEVSDIETLSVANIVIGMNSVFLMYALTLNIPTVSLKQDPNDYDQKIEIIPYLKETMVKNSSELKDSLCESLDRSYEYHGPIILDSVERAWNEIRILQSDGLNHPNHYSLYK